MNPYRTEKVLVDIRKRNVAQPIAVCASTDVEIELSVFAEGNAYDCTGLTGFKAVFYISKDGRADTFQAVEAKRGKMVFRIPADHLGYPGEYRWQVIVAVEGKVSEWARGDFFIRANPAADFEPMQLLDPPFVRKDEVLDEVDAESELPVQSKVLHEALSGISTPIAPSTDASAAGKPADAKATGDQLAAKLSKTEAADTYATQTALGIVDGVAQAATADAARANYDISQLATVASTGSYTDLTNTPTIPTVPVQSVNGKTGAVVLTASDVGAAPAAAVHYAIDAARTVSGQLADRACNRVIALADNVADIMLTFPGVPQEGGVYLLAARDFLVLVTNTMGNTGSIIFSPPSGAVVYGDGFTNSPASGETWLYSVTEVALNTFWVKSVKMEVAQ